MVPAGACRLRRTVLVLARLQSGESDGCVDKDSKLHVWLVTKVIEQGFLKVRDGVLAYHFDKVRGSRS